MWACMHSTSGGDAQHVCVCVCRSAFLTNQRVETPSTWGHVMPNFADAEKAGVQHYSRLGCMWAPGGGPAPSGDSTSTAAPATNGTNGTATDGARPVACA